MTTPSGRHCGVRSLTFPKGMDAGAGASRSCAAMQVEGVKPAGLVARRGDHNRSVVTIAGAPEAVVEAAVRGAGKASRS